jgi:hypothetical protein
MMEHKEEIEALLVYQQFEQGVDSKGQMLRQYTPFTEYLKKQSGTYSGKTDLHDTGEFQAGITLRVEGETYTLDSPAKTVEGILKSEWLTTWNKAKGGSEVMEFTPENKKEIWDIILPTFKEKSANELRG